MPVYTTNTIKLLVLNEDKTRGVSIEFPGDMKNGELLDKINDLRSEIQKSIEAELKKANEEKEAKKDQVQEAVVEAINKA